MEAAATVATAAGTAALKYVCAHPYSSAASAVSLGLTPVLGPAWPVSLALRGLGFSQAGVVGGMKLR